MFCEKLCGKNDEFISNELSVAYSSSSSSLISEVLLLGLIGMQIFVKFLTSIKKTVGYGMGLQKFVFFVIMNQYTRSANQHVFAINLKSAREFYIPTKWILLWYSRQGIISQQNQDEAEFRNLLKTQLQFQLQFQMLRLQKTQLVHSCKFQLRLQ